MIAVIATLYVKPECVAEFEENFVLMAAAVRKDEPGNHLYQPARSPEEVGVYKVLELYDDVEAQMAHRASAHFQKFSAVFAPMFSQPADVIRLDAF